MSRMVVIRRPNNDWEWITLGFFFGPFILVGIILYLPFLLAVEVKAWLARHRIRKERLASQDLGL